MKQSKILNNLNFISAKGVNIIWSKEIKPEVLNLIAAEYTIGTGTTDIQYGSITVSSGQINYPKEVTLYTNISTEALLETIEDCIDAITAVDDYYKNNEDTLELKGKFLNQTK